MRNKVLAVLIIISLSLSFCTPKSEQAKIFLSDGIAKIYKSEFKEAIIDFDKAIELQPDLFEAYFYRGNAHLNLKELEKAITNYDKAIELNPNYVDAYVNRGTVKSYLFNDQSKGCADWLKAEELGKHNLTEKTKWCK